MGPGKLEPLFNPRSIAVFGASQSGKSVGSLVYANLLTGGFVGPVIPINPKHKRIDRKKCFAKISDVKQDVDLAVIATPARTVVDIIRQCGEAGISYAIVLSAGFGETGAEGKAREAVLLDAARDAGVRFMGPNCVGMVRPRLGVNATFLNSVTPKGGLALVSQSGALCSAIADWAAPHHLGFSAIVSLGNSVDLDFGDVVGFLANDAATTAILLYVEGVRHARSFVSALRAAARVKPVIVLKAGRHNQGSAAASTHTGALIGSDMVFEAALERAGAVRVETFGQLFAAAEILSTSTYAMGGRLGIITNGGGAGVLAADRAGDLGLDLPKPSDETIDALNDNLPRFWSKRNPIDILGDAVPETYATAVKACMDDPAFDGVLVMLTPQAMTEAADTAKAVLKALPERRTKPILACWMGETSVAEARALLSAGAVADFSSPEHAVEAFSYLARQNANRKLALETPGPLSEFELPDIDGARMILQGVLGQGREMLSDIESKALLRAFRIPCNVTIEAETAAKALIAAETVGFPVAMKINSPDITHKSDVGGVRTGIMNATDVQLAFREITNHVKEANPEANILGVTVEKMADIEEARELLVGVSRDPVFGPVILFGAGGTMVEVLSDSAVSLPPLNEVLADRLINRTKVSRLLQAFRHRPAADRTSLIETLLRISDLVCEFPEIEELDINPLFAGPDGVLAVDARIRVSRPPAGVSRYSHMAITPYPRHLITEDLLADGTPLIIRPIRPEDAESEQNFVRGLSAEARQFRFMYSLKELTPALLAQFTQIDYSQEMALVAFTQEKGKQVQQGVARYVINPDGTSCEFAIVVSDRRQNQGIGTRLMTALMDAARDHGMKVMEGTVLAVNSAMLQLMKDLGFSTARSEEDPDTVVVERRL
jgi:acetyltransferase